MSLDPRKIKLEFYQGHQLGDAFRQIDLHKLYNVPEDDTTTILPLLKTGSNYQGDTPEACVLAFDNETGIPVAMGLVTKRQIDETGESYSVGHLFVSKSHRGFGIGSQLIDECLSLAGNRENIYWYYTNSSQGLYYKHSLQDVILFEVSEGIYRDESNVSVDSLDSFVSTKKTTKKNKHMR